MLGVDEERATNKEIPQCIALDGPVSFLSSVSFVSFVESASC